MNQTDPQPIRDPYAREIIDLVEQNPVNHRNSTITIGIYIPQHQSIVTVHEFHETQEHLAEERVREATEAVTERALQSPGDMAREHRVTILARAMALALGISTVPAPVLGAILALTLQPKDPPILLWALLSAVAGLAFGIALLAIYLARLTRTADRTSTAIARHRSINRPTEETQYRTTTRHIMVRPAPQQGQPTEVPGIIP